MSAALHTVHVRVNDAATGKPTPVRIRFTGPNGEHYAPFGRLTDFPIGYADDVGGHVLLGEERHTYIDGTCEIRMPAGPVTISVSKGPEYEPLRQQVVLGPGKKALRLAVRRWADLRREGWYSGDTEARFLTPHAALREAAAEDLAVVNLLACEYEVPDPFRRDWGVFEEPEERRSRWRRRLSNIDAFSGQRPALEMPGHMVVVNTRNESPYLGTLALLNCHRVVYPLCSATPYASDSWTLADWCDQCHRKGGLVIALNLQNHRSDYRGEVLADLILGKVDAFQVSDRWTCPNEEGELGGLWADLLNCGFRLPIVGGSGKVSNRDLLGGTRTYARLREGESFSYQTWIEAVRAGRTFATTGPLLALQVDGRQPGEIVNLPDGTGTIHVRAEARSWTDLERLELILNGRIIAAVDAAGTPASAVLERDVPMSASGWLAARCLGPFYMPGMLQIGAQISPVYVQVQGRPMRPDPQGVARLVGDLDHMREWVRQEAGREADKQCHDLVGILEAARQELLRRNG